MARISGSEDTRGRRTIVETLFLKAQTTPDRTFGSYAKTDNVKDGFQDFTFSVLARGVQACAWFIKDTFGISESFETLLYLGINDYRYTIVLYAAVLCGYKALFINPKYPLQNITLIMDKTNCTKVLHSQELQPTINSIVQTSPKTLSKILPPPSHWLATNPEPFLLFDFSKSFSDRELDPILVLHSSGTTGSPKPITYNNAWLALQDYRWPDIDNRPSTPVTFREQFNGGFTYSQFPQCHYGGVQYTNLRPLWTQSAASVLGPPGQDGADMAVEVMKAKGVKALAATPLLLERIFKVPEGPATLRRLNAVSFAGGPLRSDIGDALTRDGVRLMSSYGLTEQGSCPVVLPDPQDWEWMQFHPDFHASLEPTGDGAGTHELIFPDTNGEVNKMRGTYWSLGFKDYRTKDLFVRHPEKDWLWKYFGRKDDILVLENAGKLNPIPIENVIAQHPGVSGVLVAGMWRWPACVLVEPIKNVGEEDKFVDELKTKLEQANQGVREDLRVPSSMLALLKPGGLVRGLKGQIVRNHSVEANKEVIEGLYEARTAANGASK